MVHHPGTGRNKFGRIALGISAKTDLGCRALRHVHVRPPRHLRHARRRREAALLLWQEAVGWAPACKSI